MKRVLIAAIVDPKFVDTIQHDPRFETVYTPIDSEARLSQAVGTVNVLVTRYHNAVTRRVLDSAGSLDLIVQGTSGLDNIDAAAAAERGITVAGLPGENANAVAEYVIGNLIALTRTIPFYNREIHAQIWQRDDCASRREMRGHRLGIVGIGRVGSRVAALASAFRMPVHAFDPYLDVETIRQRGASRVEELGDLLARVSILTLHVPLTAETRGMIGRPQLEQLSRSSIVVNAARGAILDIDAALDLLNSNHLGGLVLDVFPDEPPGTLSLPDDPRIIATPHIAGCTAESKASIGSMLYRTICAHYGLEPHPVESER